jgi:hypothetical protein
MHTFTFWTRITKCVIDDFHSNPTSLKNTACALIILDATLEHYAWEIYKTKKKATDYLDEIRSNVNAFRHIHEASNCLKHSVRTSKKSVASGSKAISIKINEYGISEFGVGEFGSPSAPTLTYDDGSTVQIREIIFEAKEWFTTKITM